MGVRNSMTLNEYQLLAGRTMNPNLTPDETEMHALHGLAGEVGEIHSLYQKVYQGHEMDYIALTKEMGDALWMLSELSTAIGVRLEDIAVQNIDKLRKRYPDGFDPERSRHRDASDT